MDVEDRDAEAALAAALAEVSADSDYWREYAEAHAATGPAPLLAQRAVDLYRSVVAFMGKSPDVDPDAPAVQAVSAAREIGDWECSRHTQASRCKSGFRLDLHLSG